MDGVLLYVRVALSLAVVLGVMWALSRVVRKRVPQVRGLPVQLISRTPMGRRSSVVVLAFGDRSLLVGVTPQSMVLLGETPAREPQEVTSESRTTVDLASELGATTAGGQPGGQAPDGVDGALSGSVLSLATWRRGLAALRERTVRT